MIRVKLDRYALGSMRSVLNETVNQTYMRKELAGKFRLLSQGLGIGLSFNEIEIQKGILGNDNTREAVLGGATITVKRGITAVNLLIQFCRQDLIRDQLARNLNQEKLLNLCHGIYDLVNKYELLYCRREGDETRVNLGLEAVANKIFGAAKGIDTAVLGAFGEITYTS